MLTREEVRRLALESKDRLGLTWSQVGQAIGCAPLYAAFLVYGYGQATTEEAAGLAGVLALPEEAQSVLRKAPHRTPAQPWPPTDPFIYRLYEVVLLYGPVFKDVAHELFGDGIISAIDMTVDIQKEDSTGAPAHGFDPERQMAQVHQILDSTAGGFPDQGPSASSSPPGLDRESSVDRTRERNPLVLSQSTWYMLPSFSGLLLGPLQGTPRPGVRKRKLTQHPGVILLTGIILA